MIEEDTNSDVSLSTVCGLWINILGAKRNTLDPYLVHVVNSA